VLTYVPERQPAEPAALTESDPAERDARADEEADVDEQVAA